MRIQLRLADFGDVDMGRNTHHLGNLAAQAVNVLALLADHDAGARAVDRDARRFGRTLDLNAAHRGMLELLLDEVAHPKICLQVVGELGALRVPLGGPICGNAKPDACWMYFVAHVPTLFPNSISCRPTSR